MIESPNLAMRLHSLVGLLLAALLLVTTGASVSFAQSEYDLRYPGADPRPRQSWFGGSDYGARQRSSTYSEPREPSGYGSQPRRLQYYDPRTGAQRTYESRPVERPTYNARPAQPSSDSPFRFLFGGGQEPSAPVYERPREARRPVYTRPTREARRSYEPPPRKVRRYVPAAPKPEKPEVAEVEPSTYVGVFGDALAELVADGLDTALEDAEDIGVERTTKSDSSLVRPDVQDWPKAIREALAAEPKIKYAVMMLGTNERQAIREGEVTHDPLSDRWKELYRQRVDDVIQAFAEKNVPLLWVGAPPVKNEKLSADLLAINDIYKERVQRAGKLYVDVWQGFVDDQNRYTALGPDVNGQTVRLRAADGIMFTKAGARKAAHFVDVELKRLMETRGGGTAVAGQPTEGQQAVTKEAEIDRIISASLPALPEPQGLPSLPARPLAGPVVPLTKAETAPGGTLVSGRPRMDGDAAYLADRAMREGVPPPPRPGRADDFKWPRS